ncbi:MAG: NADPH:quinone reductase Zn-dependent oxidoreductase [Candidatus Saccharibacteria bacterium]|nr:NADPH:quinone reductase Zn-dependent oxidoreductase [Candidatus Saccharibacteria bacterium]
MKAAQINEFGDNSVITIQEADKPTVSAGQVLIEVHAASLNPVDSGIRSGYLQEMAPVQLPVTLGGDIAGVVVEVAEDVDDFTVGDKVYGQSAAIFGVSGAFAEFANANVGQIAKIPSNLDFQQAASLPLTASSAVQALVHHAELKEGQKVFIHGGTGGVGSIAIQVAKALGAYVATTATAEGIEQVKKLGADEVIDYKIEDFTNKLSGYDVVLNNVLGEFDKTLSILKAGAVAVSLTGPADEALVEKLGITTVAQFTQVSGEILNTLNDMLEAGKVTPQVSRVYSLDDVAKAFEDRENNSIRGKVVIAVKR